MGISIPCFSRVAIRQAIWHVNTTQPVQINQDNRSNPYLTSRQPGIFVWINPRPEAKLCSTRAPSPLALFATKSRSSSRSFAEKWHRDYPAAHLETCLIRDYSTPPAECSRFRGVYSQPIGDRPRMFRESWSLPDSLLGSVLACKLRGLTRVSNRNVLLAVCKLTWTLSGCSDVGCGLVRV